MQKFLKWYGVLVATFLLAACQTATNFTFQSAISNSGEKSQTVSGLLFKPTGKGPFPAVILLHTCGGLGPHVTQDWPDFLTGLGYVVLSVDSYSPRGMNTCRDANPHERLVWQSEDAYGALDSLANLPEIDGNRVALMGFSQGGRAINNVLLPYRSYGQLKSSKGLEFKAAIPVYGDCGGLWSMSKVPFPVMQIVGDKDPIAETCRGVDEITNVALRILPGVYHSFDSFRSDGRYDGGGKLMIYDFNAVAKAHEMTRTFLAKHLGK